MKQFIEKTRQVKPKNYKNGDRIEPGDLIEWFTTKSNWELATCVENYHGFFKVLCLDGDIRQMNWGEEDAQWRLPY